MKTSMIIFMYSSNTAVCYIILPADMDTKHFLLSLKFFTHQHPLLKSDNKKTQHFLFIIFTLYKLPNLNVMRMVMLLRCQVTLFTNFCFKNKEYKEYFSKSLLLDDHQQQKHLRINVQSTQNVAHKENQQNFLLNNKNIFNNNYQKP